MSELLQNLPTRHHKAFSCLEVPTGNGAHTSNGALSPTVSTITPYAISAEGKSLIVPLSLCVH